MIEIIVSLAVLSSSMLAVFGVLRMCASANMSSQRLSEAVFLGEKLLAETALSDRISYQTTGGTHGQFTWLIQTAGTAMDNLATVSVTISWLDQQRAQHYQLHSLIHIPDRFEGR